MNLHATAISGEIGENAYPKIVETTRPPLMEFYVDTAKYSIIKLKLYIFNYKGMVKNENN